MELLKVLIYEIHTLQRSEEPWHLGSLRRVRQLFKTLPQKIHKYKTGEIYLYPERYLRNISGDVRREMVKCLNTDDLIEY